MLERYFETKVAVPPYRHNTLKTFIVMLNTQAKVLRDFIRILQLEITSDPNNPQVSHGVGTKTTLGAVTVPGPKQPPVGQWYLDRNDPEVAPVGQCSAAVTSVVNGRRRWCLSGRSAEIPSNAQPIPHQGYI